MKSIAQLIKESMENAQIIEQPIVRQQRVSTVDLFAAHCADDVLSRDDEDGFYSRVYVARNTIKTGSEHLARAKSQEQYYDILEDLCETLQRHENYIDECQESLEKRVKTIVFAESVSEKYEGLGLVVYNKESHYVI